jgi:hypothetical protein
LYDRSRKAFILNKLQVWANSIPNPHRSQHEKH